MSSLLALCALILVFNSYIRNVVLFKKNLLSTVTIFFYFVCTHYPFCPTAIHNTRLWFLAVMVCPHTRSSVHWPATWTNQILSTNLWTWPITMPCGTRARYHVCIHHFLLYIHAAPTWLYLSSFQGAAFGFHMIAAKAGEQLAPFLPQIIPRLYRYQFDPNLSIRQAMTSIWDALVTDKTLVRAHSCVYASIKTCFACQNKCL